MARAARWPRGARPVTAEAAERGADVLRAKGKADRGKGVAARRADYLDRRGTLEKQAGRNDFPLGAVAPITRGAEAARLQSYGRPR